MRVRSYRFSLCPSLTLLTQQYRQAHRRSSYGHLFYLLLNFLVNCFRAIVPLLIRSSEIIVNSLDPTSNLRHLMNLDNLKIPPV